MGRELAANKKQSAKRPEPANKAQQKQRSTGPITGETAIIHLQRQAGNRAVSNLIQARFVLSELKTIDPTTYQALLSKAGPGWPAAKEDRLKPLAELTNNGKELLELIEKLKVPHTGFSLLAELLKLTGDAQKLLKLYAKILNPVNLKRLLELIGNADELWNLLQLVPGDTLKNLLETARAHYALMWTGRQVVEAYLASAGVTWNKSTYYDSTESILDHHSRHVSQLGRGESIQQYVTDAKNCWDNALPGEKHPGQFQGQPRIKVLKQGSTMGGNYSPTGEIYTFWYQ